MQQQNLTSVKYWFNSQNTLLFIMLQHATFHDNNKKQMKLYNYIVFVFVLAVITAFSLKWWLMFFTNSDFKEEAQTYMEQLNLGKSIDKTFNWLKQQIDLNQGKLYESRNKWQKMYSAYIHPTLFIDLNCKNNFPFTYELFNFLAKYYNKSSIYFKAI